MSIFYLDTSVALRALLGHSPSASAWLDAVTGSPEDVVVSSRVIQTEMTRVLRREGLAVKLRDEILGALTIVPLTAGVLAAAEAIEPHVKALDAIHLGSVIAVGLDAIIVTHDAGMASAATSLGYSVLDPISETG